MSDRMTRSPSFRPSSTSTKLTDRRPSLTGVRSASRRASELEQRDRAVLLAERRALHKQHVLEPLQFDRRRPRSDRAARPSGSASSSVTSTPTVPPADAGSMRVTWPLIDAVAGVDLGKLANREVARLRFRDSDFGLEARRIRDARQVRARAHLLADFDAAPPGAVPTCWTALKGRSS